MGPQGVNVDDNVKNNHFYNVGDKVKNNQFYISSDIKFQEREHCLRKFMVFTATGTYRLEYSLIHFVVVAVSFKAFLMIHNTF